MEDVHTGSISFWDQDRACLDSNLTEITFRIGPINSLLVVKISQLNLFLPSRSLLLLILQNF